MPHSPGESEPICPCRNCGCGLNEPVRSNSTISEGRIQELLGRNDPPSDAELNNLTDTVAHETRRLELLDAQIFRLQGSLEALTRMRELTASSVAEHRALINPVRRLPLDILHEIFLCCISQENIITENGTTTTSGLKTSLDPRQPPWTLTHVSGHWRNVALSFPGLWSCINIVVNNKTKDRQLTSLLSLQLQRSMCHTLSVSMTVMGVLSPPSRSFMPLLLQTSSRWHTLHIQGPEATLNAFDQVEGFLQSLHTLRIRTTPSSSQLFSNFRLAPRLRSVDIAYSPQYQLPWSQITSCKYPKSHIQGTSNQLCLNMLSTATSLETCELCCENDLLEVFLPFVESNNLRRLTLWEGQTPGATAQLLRHLTLPALESLIISAEVDLETVLSLLSRSQFTLTELQLNISSWSMTACLQLFREIPSIETLYLLTPSMRLTSAMLAKLHDTQVVPALRLLVAIGKARPDEDALGGLMAARPNLQIEYKRA